MNADILADILRRLVALEKTSVRYRAGEITGTGPLDVALGGSSVPFEDVRLVTPGAQTGDVVATLVFGNDLLVLGRIGESGWTGGDRIGSGTGTWTWPGGSAVSSQVTVTHGLGFTPTRVLVCSNIDQGGTEMISGLASDYTATTFKSRGSFKSFTPGAGGTSTFVWIAVG